MALGFGFNKTKVLSAAEKFVQQGKLQNAITEYEKVVKEDPKDLTVLNTIGDLYARVGQNDKACEYFKKVGDQYAQNGFTVKAIAIYKKLTKLNPSTSDPVIKLAELYTQQGLFNDARTQYMQVADQLLRSGDNNQAARILQKILELDPENTSTQSKLADLYIKLGKNDDARNIYYSAAESLYARRSYDAADESLGRVLKLDPGNSKALLLRGMITADSGDSGAAIEYLEQVPDIDSRPDALRALLRAKLQVQSLEGAEGLAAKLLTVHQDTSGLVSLAEWFATHQHEEDALKIYERYTDRFLMRGPAAFVTSLHPLINRIRNSPAALTSMLNLLHKAGDTSHLNEVMELLAHAHVQGGNFDQARDLYKELSDLEPENPLHLQNYRQMLARLGEDPMARQLSPEEGTQALMVEELEHGAPVVRQEYSPAVEKALEAALTDAELFVSYNVPLKAIAPLEAALPLAPRDLNLNQRLASLYARAERYGDAARVCETLSRVYEEAGHQAEAARYSEAAEKYAQRAATTPAPVAQAAVAAPPPVAPPEPPAATVKEFVLDVPEEFFEVTPPAEPPPEIPKAETAPESMPVQAEAFQATPAELPVEPVRDVDLSHDWESMMSVEDETAPADAAPIAAAPAQSAPPAEVQAPSTPPATPAAMEQPVAALPDSSVEDKVQEIQFYISQGFWDMARAGVEDLSQLAPESSEIASLRARIAAGEQEAAAAAAAPAKPVEVAKPAEPPPAEKAAPLPVESVPAAKTAPPELVVQKPSQPELEESILDIEEPAPPPPPAPVAKPVEPPRPPVQAAASTQPAIPPADKSTEDVLSDFVLDLEESLGDFLPAQPPTAPAQPESSTLAAAASTSPVPAASAAAAPIKPLTASPAAQSHPAASSNGGIHDAEATSVLSNILAELQEDLGEDAAPAPEDPETHYNLGIAFKEMGLLDEAIGELQKVCHGVERGVSFSQPVQAFTWLAQCLVDKGVPEAAVRWYEKALKLPGLDHDSRCAICYDLGSAYEASGDNKAALANFMEVYSSNIDFRDVASRIKVLKS